MDLNQITMAMTTLKTATELLGLIKASDVSLDKAETKLKLANLTETLADLKLRLVDVKVLVSDKETEIRILKDQLNQKKSMSYEEPYYWVVEDGKNDEGPFCQKCYDGAQKLIRLQSQDAKGCWKCCECKNFFYDKSYIAPAPRISTRSSFVSRW